jgi:hypothetical protein
MNDTPELEKCREVAERYRLEANAMMAQRDDLRHQLAAALRERDEAREAIRAALAEQWLLDPQCDEDQALVDRLKEEAAK